MIERLPDIRSRRIRRVEISTDLILDLLRIPEGGIDGYRIECESDRIPDSAVALRCDITEHGTVMLVMEDDSFCEIHDGILPPRMMPIYTKTIAP
jgi:hypothetical protein